MKYIIITLLTLSSCVYASSQKTEPKKIMGTIIAPVKETPHPWTREGDSTAHWIVTQEMIEKLHPLLVEYIKKSDSQIYSNLDKYRCLYLGIVVNGNHQIYCSFFWYQEKHHKDWEQWTYPWTDDTCDGGRHFFRFVYDVTEGQCKGFRRNGP